MSSSNLVIQLTEIRSLNRNIRSIENLLREIESLGENINVEIVLFQSAVTSLRRGYGESYQKLFEKLLSKKVKVRILACEQALQSYNIDKKDIYDFIETVPSGIAYVYKRIIEGWKYMCLP